MEKATINLQLIAVINMHGEKDLNTVVRFSQISGKSWKDKILSIDRAYYTFGSTESCQTKGEP